MSGRKLSDFSEEEIKEYAEKARKWALSNEGQEELKKVIAETEKIFGPDQCNCSGCRRRRIREASNRMGPLCRLNE